MKVISGIQQMGVGVTNVHEAWKWYRQNFGMDIRVFEEAAIAQLMVPHTEGKPRERHAVLTINMQGGGGFEVWQHTGKIPELPKFEIKLGDLGIFITKLKCKDVHAAFAQYKSKGLNLLSKSVLTDPKGNPHFFVKDPYNNIFQIEPSDAWFKTENCLTGGVYGCIIGVSNIDKSLKVYSDILGYDQVVYDSNGNFNDFENLAGGKNEFRRILLRHSQPRKGGFSRLLGPSEIELVQVKDRTPESIFKDRIWGDPGFIHLCFDIIGMKDLRNECISKGFPFTVDSSESFDMGEAAGHFSYIADPDGVLIEFVETHKVPVLKKIGWYFNLKGRNPEKPLSDWMVKTLAFNRVKD